jgi:phospholipid transport system substrate-binding protein
MPNDMILTRRGFGMVLLSGLALAASPHQAFALTAEAAKSLVDKTVAEINSIISSGRSEGAMLGEFEKLFARYADVKTIARSALGPAARQATPAQLAGFTKAFQGYISRKYGRRFREFIGGRIEVNDARAVKSYFEVITTAYLSGESPFEVRFHVSDKAVGPAWR